MLQETMHLTIKTMHSYLDQITYIKFNSKMQDVKRVLN